MSQEQLEVIGNDPGDDIPGENIADGNNDENLPGDLPLLNDARELARQIEEKKLKEAQEDCDVAMALVDVQFMEVSGLRGRGEITDCMEAIDRKCTAVEQKVEEVGQCMKNAGKSFRERVAKLSEYEAEICRYRTVIRELRDKRDAMYEEIKRQERELQRRSEIEEKLKEQELSAIFAKKNEKDVNVRLPKLELRKFKGDLMQWTEFWEQYRVSIHTNKNLGTLEKFTDLKGNLEGPPLTTIGPLALTEENYEKAIGMLEDCYGRPDKIQEAHLRTMEEISPIFEASDGKRLRKFQEMIEGHQKGLEAVGIEPKSYEMIMVPKLMRKLPLLIRAQIAKSRKDISKPLTWKEFMEALKKEVTFLEDCKGEKRDEKPRYDRPKREERKSEEKSGTWTTGQSLLVRKKDDCACCLGDHEPGSCEKVTTVTKRKEILKRYRRCFGCLRKGHITRDCKSKKACECGKGDHHKSLSEEVVPGIVVGIGKPDLVDRNRASVAYQTVLVKVSDLGNSSEVTCRAMLELSTWWNIHDTKAGR